jgi:hypothetical protein
VASSEEMKAAVLTNLVSSQESLLSVYIDYKNSFKVWYLMLNKMA